MRISCSARSVSLLATLVVFGLVFAPKATAQRTGEEIFTNVCKACHTMGGGRLVGPDLKGVNERVPSTEWLEKFIRGSQAMVNAGDKRAVELFNEYKVPMPDTVVTNGEMASLIAYLGSDATTGGAAAAGPAGDPDEGRDIFQGRIRLKNGGPACNSCHHVTNDAVIGGGVLAKDLTQVFSRLGSNGVRAVLGSQPFPVMERAYQENPLETTEVAALVAFLEKAAKEEEFQQPKDYGIMLLLSGLGGAALLFGFFALFWRGRKRETVNAAIYDRQIASS